MIVTVKRAGQAGKVIDVLTDVVFVEFKENYVRFGFDGEPDLDFNTSEGYVVEITRG